MFERRTRSVRPAVRPRMAVGWSEGVWPLSWNPSHQVQHCLQHENHVDGRTMPQASGPQGQVVRWADRSIDVASVNQPVGNNRSRTLPRFSSSAIFMRRQDRQLEGRIRYITDGYHSGWRRRVSEADGGATAEVASPHLRQALHIWS
jgi:hypothetical protein